MAAIAKGDAAAISKEFYAAGGFHCAAYEDNPGYSVAKKRKITGKHYDFPVKYGYAANRSRTAATALGKVNTTQYQEFNVTTVGSYDAKDIEQRALAEVTDEGAFVDLLTDTIESLGKSLGNGLGEDLFLHTGAALGQVGSFPSATVLQLKNPSHVTRFYVGQELRSSETDGQSGALQANSATITAIDRDLGQLTTDGGGWVAQMAAIDADDFLFSDGDFGLGRAGLPAWVPDDTTGLAVAFYGATRSLDATRLAGCRQTVTGGADIVTALRTLVMRMGREEAHPNHALMSFDMLADLETQIETKVFIDVKAKGIDMGFEAIQVTVGGRRLKCLPDRSCGDDRIYAGNMDVLEVIHSQDEPIVLDDLDGELLSRNAAAFSYDLRGSSYANFVVRQPREWGVLIFS